MVLLKRLLLPGKGDVISCMLILLNVLCAEPVISVETSSVSVLAYSPLKFFPVKSSFSVCGLMLVTFNIISCQFPRINAEAPSTVIGPQGHTLQPVLNKTDPRSSTMTTQGETKIQEDKLYDKTSSASNNSTSSNNFSNMTPFVSEVLNESGSVDLGRTTMTNRQNNTSVTMTTSSANDTSTVRQTGTNSLNSNTTTVDNSRNPKFIKEITMWNRQNCLAKLLCGVQVAQPPTSSSSALNDYAYLVKAFFDRFSIRGIVKDALDTAFTYEQETLENDELDDEDAEEDDIGTGGSKKKKKKTASKKKRKPANAKYNDEYDKDLDDMEMDELDDDDDMPDFYHDIFRRRRLGRNMTFVAPFTSQNSTGNVTLEKHKRRRAVPVNVDRVRRKRGIIGAVKRGFMGFFNPRFDKTAYLNKRQLEIESTPSQTRQLNIAEEVAARMRSPRQCRLLNWFGSGSSSTNNNNNNQASAMTTTITTITNPGGMMGNSLEKLNELANINAAASGAAAPGSVVTVIQQTPANGINGDSSMSSSDSMCPFNTKELQDLITKAQGAPFPHFLTTTTPKPTQAAPSSTTTTKAQSLPTPSSTISVVVRPSQGNSRHSPRYDYAQMYGNFGPPPTSFSAKLPHAPIVPAMGMSVGDDDEGDFDFDPYVVNPNSFNKHTTTLKRKPAPPPKWMTTTAIPINDYYNFKDAMPSYSYGTKKGGYKVDNTFQKHQFRPPPLVVDSGKRYKSAETGVGGAKKTPNSKKTGTQKKKATSDSEEDSDEKDDEEASSNEGLYDDNSDEEASSSISSSGSVEVSQPRSKFQHPTVRQFKQPVLRNPIQYHNTNPTGGFARSALTQSVEASAESSGAEETRNNDDEDYSDEDENDQGGLRSYERNEFSKDRGGPQQSSTLKPEHRYKVEQPHSGGFFSNIFNSLTGSISIRSLFNKENKKVANTGYVQPSPPRPLPTPSYSTKGATKEQDSYEQDDDEQASGEDSEEITTKKSVLPKAKPTQTVKRIPARSIITTSMPMPAAPVIIEDAASWVQPYKDYKPKTAKPVQHIRQDDSGEDDPQTNPVENYNQALHFKSKNSFYSSLPEHKLHLDNIRYMTGLPVPSDTVKNNWLGTSSKLSSKKSTVSKSSIKTTKKEDSEEDDDVSNESEEDLEGPLPHRRQIPFVTEPID